MAFALFVALAFATFASEDLACASAGILAARDPSSLGLVTAACAFGIFLGDLGLFALGRTLGRSAVHRAPLRWFVKVGDLERCSRWLESRGPAVVFISRFVPGMRLPTYVAAGVLETSALRFSLWFTLATIAWTPLLVGLSYLAARGVISTSLAGSAVPVSVGLVIGLVMLARMALLLANPEGRRRLSARWERARRWEFWPAWLFYPPVIAYICWLAIKHRSLAVFASVNPGIPLSGFVGESKSQILDSLDAERVASHKLIASGGSVDSRMESLRAFIDAYGLTYPVVLKPDVGQRGDGVLIAKSELDARKYLETSIDSSVVAQEFVPGQEFGVFYVRRPGAERGRVFSITEKCLPVVVGDGVRSVEDLIMADPRARLLSETYKKGLGDSFTSVPAAGQRVRLVEVGSHCKGAVFLDANYLKTPELEEAIDDLSRTFSGFYFGRFDLRVPDRESLRAGQAIRVLELNGVTSEATHIYDPRTRIVDAYRVMFQQWSAAFEIGAHNVRQGSRAYSVIELARAAFRFALATQ